MEAAPSGPPNLESLVAILRGLPHAEGLEVEHLFGSFIAAVNRVTPLREGEIADFIGEVLGELQAYQEAYLGARSPMTGLGLGLKGAALIGAFLVSMGVETWTGMKGFGPRSAIGAPLSHPLLAAASSAAG